MLYEYGYYVFARTAAGSINEWEKAKKKNGEK